MWKCGSIYHTYSIFKIKFKYKLLLNSMKNQLKCIMWDEGNDNLKAIERKLFKS